MPNAPDIQVPPGTTNIPPPDDPESQPPYDAATVAAFRRWRRLGSLKPANKVTWGVGRVELASTVVPGGQAVFGFVITAPSTPGTYSFSWGMLRELLFWFGNTASTTITVTAPTPVYEAQLISATVPTQMTAGTYYKVSLTFKNTGNVIWTQSDYRIGSTSPDDNTTWSLNRVNLGAASVAPGQSATFNFQVRAPATAGTYLFDWGMLWELHWRLGQTSRTYVTVNPVATTPRPTITASHTPMVAGQSFTMNGSTTNATSLTNVCTAAGTGYTVSESLTTVAGTSGSVRYIHTDGLGSPVARTDASGAVISRTRYEPYGYVAAGTQPTIG